MSHFNDHSRMLARKRMARRGAEDLSGMLGLFGMLFLPFWWIIKYSALLMWWMMKGMFWLFFWPIKLFKK